MEDNRGFGTGRVDGAAGEAVARLHRHRDVPGFVLIQGRDRHPPADEVAGLCGDRFQRPFDAVENIRQDPRAQGGAQRAARRMHRFTRMKAGGVFIDLDGGLPVIDADDLAYQPVFSHQDRFHHGQTGFPEQGDDRAVDTVYGIAHAGSRLSVNR